MNPIAPTCDVCTDGYYTIGTACIYCDMPTCLQCELV